MSDDVLRGSDWSLSQEAFDRLLAALDPERERAGILYRQTQEDLIKLFTWRGCPSPEEHADETINRVARKVAAGESFEDIRVYFFGVARMLVLEIFKRQERAQRDAAALAREYSASVPEDEAEREARVMCLQRCLLRIPTGDRELVLNYYEGEKGSKIENRRRMARGLGVTLGTLRMQMLRLRARLEACVKACLEEQAACDENG